MRHRVCIHTALLLSVSLVGCESGPPRPPLARDSGVPVDAALDAGMPIDAPGLDAPPPDAPRPDAGTAPDAGPPPGSGTWTGCVPEATDRICYLLPPELTDTGGSMTLQQRIAIDDMGVVTEAGSVPPFQLRIAPTSAPGEHPVAGSSSSGATPYLEWTFFPEEPLDAWDLCVPGARRFRVLRAGTRAMAVEFEVDCTTMTDVQIRGAVLGSAAFGGWRTDPIDGL